MPTLIGPPMQPPLPPYLTGNTTADIEALLSYLNELVAYLLEYRPTVEAP